MKKTDRDELEKSLNVEDSIPSSGEDGRQTEVEKAIAEIHRVSEMMKNGQLDERGRVEQFSGPSAELIQVVNQMLDVLVVPLRLTANSIQQMAHGSIPDFLIDEYSGEFNQIKKNVNTFSAVLYGMHHEAQNLIKAVKEGKLGTRGNDWDFEGNWRDLISGMNATLDAVMDPVKEASRVLGRLSNFDLSARMDGRYKGDHAQIKKALNTSLHALHDAFDQVATAVKKVSSAGVEIQAVSREVSQGAFEQANSISETSTRLEQISAEAKQTASHTEQATEITREAQRFVEAGRETMNKMMEAVSNIQSSAEGTLDIIQEINNITAQTEELATNAALEATKVGASARGFAVVADEVRKFSMQSKNLAVRITALEKQKEEQSMEGTQKEVALLGNGSSDIIKEINAIAMKTNFLALNAAVEAAHVGEAGRGFEVVTEKVQTLASRSKECSVKTETMLQRSVDLAKKGKELSNEVNQVLMKVVESVTSVSGLVNEIASASKEEAQGVDFVNERVTKIKQITQDNAGNADKCSKAVEELTKQTGKLETSVKRFKLYSNDEAASLPNS